MTTKPRPLRGRGFFHALARRLRPLRRLVYTARLAKRPWHKKLDCDMALAISPERTRIGWIGTGVMGRSMCGHLIGAGYNVTLFTRTKTKAAELVERGATWAGSPREVAAASDVVISIVGFPHDVREVMLGDDGALAGSKAGNIFVDMTTSEPSLAVEIAERAAKRDVASVDAPVSGGDVGARNATLSIMIGGDATRSRRSGTDLEDDGIEVGLPRWPRRRPAYEDGQPDSHRYDDDRSVRGAVVRTKRPGSIWRRYSSRSRRAPRAAGRSQTMVRA